MLLKINDLDENHIFGGEPPPPLEHSGKSTIALGERLRGRERD